MKKKIKNDETEPTKRDIKKFRKFKQMRKSYSVRPSKPARNEKVNDCIIRVLGCYFSHLNLATDPESGNRSCNRFWI